MTTTIKTTLDTFLNQQNSWQIQLLKNWATIVGSFKTNVQLLKIYEDTLIVGVQDSCWLQELYLLSPLLIQTINSTLDTPRIKNLRFKTVGLSNKKIRRKDNQKKFIKKEVALSPRELLTLASIKDEQLRLVLREYLIRMYQEK